MKRLTLLFALLAGCAAPTAGPPGYDVQVTIGANPANPGTTTCVMDWSGAGAGGAGGFNTPAKSTCNTRHATLEEWEGCTSSAHTGGVFQCELRWGAIYNPTQAPFTDGTWIVESVTSFAEDGTTRQRVTHADMVAEGQSVTFTLGSPPDAGVGGQGGSAGAGGVGGTGPQPAAISSVWAQSGEDKITQDEIRGGSETNNVWNCVTDVNGGPCASDTIYIDGMKNEVVSFNTVIEAATAQTASVTVSIDSLTRTGGGGTLVYKGDRSDVFAWAGADATDIELFYTRYLQVEGLSALSYDMFTDERQVPAALQRPDPPNNDWVDRPDADKFYPEIAVPLELENGFTIAAGNNQQVWADIYIPPDAAAGEYTGNIRITESGQTQIAIPISLTVHNLTMPDDTAHHFAWLGESELNQRWAAECGLGDASCYPNPGFPEEVNRDAANDNFHQAFRRHRVTLFGGPDDATQLTAEWTDRLDGSLFSADQGYAGPGQDDGLWLYVIGDYGDWIHSWNGSDWANIPGDMSSINAIQGTWATAATTYPNTIFAQYLCDETNCDVAPGAQAWAAALKGTANGPGIPLMLTKGFEAYSTVTDADWHMDWPSFGTDDSVKAPAHAAIKADGTLTGVAYNGKRPFVGSFALEDEGASLRNQGWVQAKLGIDSWFFWAVNNWRDSGLTAFDTFNQAQTFGYYTSDNVDYGKTGSLYSNGDGTLSYPGTDTLYPAESYGLDGPIMSLRAKHWRRAAQDFEWIEMARAADSTATNLIVNAAVPEVYYEIDLPDGDPTYVVADISWDIDPDTWDDARKALLPIIESGGGGAGGAGGAGGQGGSAPAPLQSDNFDTGTISPFWSECIGGCPVGECTFVESGSLLTTTVDPTTTNELWGSNADAVCGLYQPLATVDADFEATVKWTNPSPSNAGTHVPMRGIIATSADGNTHIYYYNFSTGGVASDLGAYYTISGSTQGALNNVDAVSFTGDAWLRMNRTGVRWTLSWSLDGVNFTPTQLTMDGGTTLLDYADIPALTGIAHVGFWGGNEGADAGATWEPVVDSFIDTSGPCVPSVSCGDPGYVCGTPTDNCGDPMDCTGLSCTPVTETCYPEGTCCTLDDCITLGAECGTPSDGCGGTLPSCGSCAVDETCDGSYTCVPTGGGGGQGGSGATGGAAGSGGTGGTGAVGGNEPPFQAERHVAFFGHSLLETQELLYMEQIAESIPNLGLSATVIRQGGLGTPFYDNYQGNVGNSDCPNHSSLRATYLDNKGPETSTCGEPIDIDTVVFTTVAPVEGGYPLGWIRGDVNPWGCRIDDNLQQDCHDRDCMTFQFETYPHGITDSAGSLAEFGVDIVASESYKRDTTVDDHLLNDWDRDLTSTNLYNPLAPGQRGYYKAALDWCNDPSDLSDGTPFVNDQTDPLPGLTPEALYPAAPPTGLGGITTRNMSSIRASSKYLYRFWSELEGPLSTVQHPDQPPGTTYSDVWATMGCEDRCLNDYKDAIIDESYGSWDWIHPRNDTRYLLAAAIVATIWNVDPTGATPDIETNCPIDGYVPPESLCPEQPQADEFLRLVSDVWSVSGEARVTLPSGFEDTPWQLLDYWNNVVAEKDTTVQATTVVTGLRPGRHRLRYGWREDFWPPTYTPGDVIPEYYTAEQMVWSHNEAPSRDVLFTSEIGDWTAKDPIPTDHRERMIGQHLPLTDFYTQSAVGSNLLGIFSGWGGVDIDFRGWPTNNAQLPTSSSPVSITANAIEDANTIQTFLLRWEGNGEITLSYAGDPWVHNCVLAGTSTEFNNGNLDNAVLTLGQGAAGIECDILVPGQELVGEAASLSLVIESTNDADHLRNLSLVQIPEHQLDYKSVEPGGGFLTDLAHDLYGMHGMIRFMGGEMDIKFWQGDDECRRWYVDGTQCDPYGECIGDPPQECTLDAECPSNNCSHNPPQLSGGAWGPAGSCAYGFGIGGGEKFYCSTWDLFFQDPGTGDFSEGRQFYDPLFNAPWVHNGTMASAIQYYVDVANALDVDMWIALPTFENAEVLEGIIQVVENGSDRTCADNPSESCILDSDCTTGICTPSPCTRASGSCETGDGLRDDLRVLIEWGNENWNADYIGWHYGKTMGQYHAGQAADEFGRVFLQTDKVGNPTQGFEEIGSAIYTGAARYEAWRLHEAKTAWQAVNATPGRVSTVYGGFGWNVGGDITAFVEPTRDDGNTTWPPDVCDGGNIKYPRTGTGAECIWASFDGSTPAVNNLDYHSTASYTDYKSPTGYPVDPTLFAEARNVDFPAFFTWQEKQSNDYSNPDGFVDSIQFSKGLADLWGVPLLAYEGGQHMEPDNVTHSTQPYLIDFNNDPRMYDVYYRNYNRWRDCGFSTSTGQRPDDCGDVFVHLTGPLNWGTLITNANRFPIMNGNLHLKTEAFKWQATYDWTVLNPRTP